jgi:hypothetical protein
MSANVILIIFLLSIVSCHVIAKRRGSNPVLLGLMGAIFSPFAIPFAFMDKLKERA